MRIGRIDRSLAVCESHLESTNSFNTEIDSLLAGAVLVIAYAEFESFINSSIQEKAQLMENEVPPVLLRDDGSPGHRGMLTSRLSDLLDHIGSEYQARFKANITGNQRAESYYNNVVTNRHNFAHSSISVVTFQEVKAFYQEGHVVLDFFRDTLLPQAPSNPSM